jgi:hypothetical protein
MKESLTSKELAAPRQDVLAKAQVELPPDIDGILEEIKTILKLGGVQSIHLSLGEPITYTRIASGGEVHPFENAQSYDGMSLTEIIRQKPMEESPYNYSNWLPTTIFLQTMIYMHLTGYIVTHLVVGTKTWFWKWLGVDPAVTTHITQLCGAKIEFDKTLNADKVLVCGAKSKAASVEEIEFSLVMQMELADEKIDAENH